jgi:hypothetical protein
VAVTASSRFTRAFPVPERSGGLDVHGEHMFCHALISRPQWGQDRGKIIGRLELSQS